MLHSIIKAEGGQAEVVTFDTNLIFMWAADCLPFLKHREGEKEVEVVVEVLVEVVEGQ